MSHSQPDRSSPLSWSDIPHDLRCQWEDDDYLATCDWGRCDGETVGWAQCDCDDEFCPEWLTICAECLARGRSKVESDPHPVARSITLEQIEAAAKAHA